MDQKADNYALLAGMSQRGDWKSWLLYMLWAVEATGVLMTYDKINDLVARRSFPGTTII